MTIRKITAAVTLSMVALGIGASAASAGDPSQWGRSHAPAPVMEKVNEYEGQHR